MSRTSGETTTTTSLEEDVERQCSFVEDPLDINAKDEVGNEDLSASFQRFEGTGRLGRRSTIFTIAENYEFDEEEFQRKLSNAPSTYSSDSSLGRTLFNSHNFSRSQLGHLGCGRKSGTYLSILIPDVKIS